MIKIIVFCSICFFLSCQNDQEIAFVPQNKIEAFEELNLKKSFYLKLTPSMSTGLSPIEVQFPYKDQQNLLKKGSNLKFDPFKQVLMRFAYIDGNLQTQFADIRGFFRVDKYVLSEATQDMDPFSSTQLLFQYPTYLQYGNDGIDFNLNYLITIFPSNLPPYQFKADTDFTLNRMDEGVSDQDYFKSRFIKNQKDLPLSFKKINGVLQGLSESILALKGIDVFAVQNEIVISSIATTDQKGLFSIGIYDQDNLLYDPLRNDQFHLYFRAKRENEITAYWKINDLNINFFDEINVKNIYLPLSEILDENNHHAFFQAIPYNPTLNRIENLQEWQFDLVSTIDLSQIDRSLYGIHQNDSILSSSVEFSSHFHLSPSFAIPYEIDDVKGGNEGNYDLIYEKRLLFVDFNLISTPLSNHVLYIHPPVNSIYRSQKITVDQNMISNFILDLETYPQKIKVKGKVLNQFQPYDLEIKKISHTAEIYHKPLGVLHTKTNENGDFEVLLDSGEYVLIVQAKEEQTPAFIGYVDVKEGGDVKLKDISIENVMIWELYPTLFNDDYLLSNIYTELYCDLSDVKKINPDSQVNVDEKIKVVTYFNAMSNVIRLPISVNLCEIHAL